MKLFCVIISAILFCDHLNAQLTSAVKYIWQNDSTKINASIEIYDTDNKKSRGSIYFITNVDTTFNSHPDNFFKQFIASSTLQYTFIKISFYPSFDSSKMSVFSKELMDFILPDVSKKYKLFSKGDAVISGINDYALVALHAAIHYSDKINKTAVFFNDYVPNVFLCNQLETSSRLIKGKLFMYVNGEEENSFITNTLAEKLAIYSPIVLYKYDDVNALASKYIFTEAYNWLMADGNNYVLKTED
ncbi:MAG: hypothetical protein LH615_08780 [Ferruginibacter sp.]|nr:hypothetical protein [Ferruginibacter sp.]